MEEEEKETGLFYPDFEREIMRTSSYESLSSILTF